MRFPALFIGHGSPMNAIHESASTDAWRKIGQELKPDAILVVSAHWNEPSVAVTSMKSPRTIHDFGAFPQKLFDQQYPAPGDPALAKRVQSLLHDVDLEVALDEHWGLDHGSWAVLTRMYPNADVPVVELNLDSRKSDLWHFEVGKKLAPLRDEKVLILASGSLVHNLRDSFMYGFKDLKYAERFRDFVKDNVGSKVDGKDHPLVNWKRHPDARSAHPTPEHYQPLLYILGLIDANKEDKVSTFLEDEWDAKAISQLAVRVDDKSPKDEL